jgi:hypothetical protein
MRCGVGYGVTMTTNELHIWINDDAAEHDDEYLRQIGNYVRQHYGRDLIKFEVVEVEDEPIEALPCGCGSLLDHEVNCETPETSRCSYCDFDIIKIGERWRRTDNLSGTYSGVYPFFHTYTNGVTAPHTPAI